MYCPQCGVKHPVAVDVCTGCGAALGAIRALLGDTALSAAGQSLRARATGSVVHGSTMVGHRDPATSAEHSLASDADAAMAATGPSPAASDELTTLFDHEHEAATQLPMVTDPTHPTARTPRTPRIPSDGTWASFGRSTSGGGPLAIGQQLGNRYRIMRLLGVGGMGAVYQAWDTELDVALAFKVIRPDATDDPAVAEEVERRFKRELLLARQVTHPNVVRIHDLGEIDSIKYITMPYIEGRDLSDLLADVGTLPVPRALALARQVVSGLCAAHEAGIVHRDLKPANIMIDGEDRALIMDFGIARSAGTTAESRSRTGVRQSLLAGATRIGAIVGTMEYMAPEQARGGEVDHRADIYAFGLILRRMLVGRQLAPGTFDPLTDLTARMTSAPVAVQQMDATIPDAVDEIVSKCLRPDPADRYETTTDLKAVLDRLDENGVRLPDPPPLWRTWRFWATATAATVALVTTTWWFALWTVPTVEPPRDPVSVLVADFTNTTGDEMFDGILEQSMGIEIEGASFVTAYDRRNALRVATQLNAGKTLNENVARLVAQREGVEVVLAGGIVRDGSGYRVSVRSLNPADGQPSLSADTRASSRNDVLNAVGRLAARVRESLGDTKTARQRGESDMLSAASLEAVSEYMKGQELTRQSRDEEAIPFFRRAVEIDPNFGRAYSAWGTAAFKLGRQAEAEDQHNKALSLLDRMTERERYRTLGVYYLAGSQNYDKAIENFETLVSLYPSDAPAYNNLGVAYSHKRDFVKASEVGRKALEIYPRNRLYRSNYALYAMYAGDFKTAADAASKLLADDPNYFMARLPLAIAALDAGNAQKAREHYEAMAAVNPRAASLAITGLADIAIVEGRHADAIALLTKGIDEDQTAKSIGPANNKRIALADAHEMEGDLPNALRIASDLVAGSKSDSILVSAARIFAAGRRSQAVDEVARMLANQFEPEKRAYGRIVDALDYLSRERYVDAVDSLREAIKFADLWLARFYLGVAYEIAGRHAEAISEFEICRKRQGEATAIFIDEVPTYRYLAPLPYWLARAQEGLGQMAQAKTNYEAFLARTTGPTKNATVAAARARVAALSTP